MSSPGRPPRSRHRFWFRGERPSRGSQNATTDEILESLTRHAQSMEREGEERTIQLQTILEVEPNDRTTQSLDIEPGRTLEHFKTRHVAKSAFALMLFGGFAFLWVYSKLRQTFNLQNVTMALQTITKAGFTDWQQVLLIALSALIFALLAQRSRSRAGTHLLSSA